MFRASGDAIDFQEFHEENYQDELATGCLSFDSFWTLLWCWSRRTFGPASQRGPIGPLRHLEKEIQEAIKAYEELQKLRAPERDDNKHSMTDRLGARDQFAEELVDCLFLVFDAAQRDHLTLIEFRKALTKKYEKNRARKWNAPTSDQPTEHVRDGE